MNYSVIVLAAGRGSRTNLDYNKVFYTFENGQTVLNKSLSVFLSDDDCKQVVLVCADYEKDYVTEKYRYDSRIQIVTGGKTRQDSVYNGLQVVNQDYVMIHDGARPFVDQEWIVNLKQTLETEDACLLMVPSVDTTKIVVDGYVKESLERKLVYHAQTPQCFKTDLIKECHQLARNKQVEATDDAQLVEWFSKTRVKVVLSSFTNKKITLPEDLKG
ncbi:2-C-methyl-D-erythritol 4-phosphate cytidylyltransferase [uncultured Holdemanella sp.]|uniref:2-C-methyl-D-erythritol 4-phosphate cytidylyltransferase n=1 Tax=uncultured Holdemanella sp. TaxID=1763549 RepID=UPI0025D38E95|nr:2-C-methyl-D-erythritol 4-phosphate cytidylyltransferase [uncultured Holdemanella sp.]